MRRIRLTFVLACAGLLTLGRLQAHNVFESTTRARLDPDAFELEVTLARTSAAEVTLSGPEIVLLDPSNFERYRPRLLEGSRGLFVAIVDGLPWPAREREVRLTPEGDAVFTLRYARPPAGPLRLRAVHLTSLGRDYSSSFTLAGTGGTKPLVLLLTSEHPEVEITLPPAGSDAPATVPTAGFGAFLKLGIEHILTGYDHLLFLAGLLVVCRRLRSMVGIITCFTLAHSFTLALAALHVFALSPRIVEPLIAASILFVGVENLVRRGEPTGRWALTFAFGLIHGFGFAGALEEIGLGGSAAAIAGPLVAFNLGVEAGQLAVMAALLPLLLWWRRRPFYERVAQPAASILVAAAGALWLLQRTVFA